MYPPEPVHYDDDLSLAIDPPNTLRDQEEVRDFLRDHICNACIRHLLNARLLPMFTLQASCYGKSNLLLFAWFFKFRELGGIIHRAQRSKLKPQGAQEFAQILLSQRNSHAEACPHLVGT